jgi:hypothetical protein
MRKLMPCRLSKPIFLFFVTGILLITLVDCATTPAPDPYKIKEADMKMVEKCEYAGFVRGSSGWGSTTAVVGVRAAKIEALHMAAKLGATHVVWTVEVGGHTPYVEGRAYHCESKH